MNQTRSLSVDVSHDVENGIWYVVESDIPGLNAEASTLDELIAVVADLAPELIEANIDDEDGLPDIPLRVQHEMNVKRRHAA